MRWVMRRHESSLYRMGFPGLAVVAMAALCLHVPTLSAAHERTEPDEHRTIDLFQRLAPATVFLSVTYDSTHPLLNPPATGVGAGFVVDEAGTVLTNSHVVEGARMVTATFYDGRRVSATLVG